MYINFKHQIKIVESMRIDDSNAERIFSELTSHQQIEDAIDKRDNAIEKITEALSELQACGKNGNWIHLDELSLADTKLRARGYYDLVDKHAGYYFSQNEIRTKELDWLYADLLIAYTFKRQVEDSDSWIAEVVAGAFFHGFLKLMEKQFLMAFVLILGKLFMWVLVAAAIAVPIIISELVKTPLYMLFSVIVLHHVLRVKHTKNRDFTALKIEVFKNVWAINRVYSLTSSERIHWDILDKELNFTREQGVKWLPSLYAAVKNVAAYNS